MRSRLSILLLYWLVIIVAFTSACAKRVPRVDTSLEQRGLPFLVDGKTKRDAVLLALGISTARFQDERILAYMLLFEEEKGFSVASRYSAFIVGPCGLIQRLSERKNVSLSNLVLAFDSDGVLAKHNFVIKSDPLESGKLAFLQNGKTTKEEVLLQLGIPSSQFEGERIITYWLNLDESKDMDSGRYSLVLVFDDRQILEKHSMIKMKRDWSL